MDRDPRAAQILALIAADRWRMDVLRAARALALPDWAIGAGFVRSRVWDWLDGDRQATVPSDIDVLYFDPADPSPERETVLERQLADRIPAAWSVTNQVRMHRDNGDVPYSSTEDALRHWLETPTCVAVRLEAGDRLTLLAPWGLDDLFAMTVRPTPSGAARPALYRRRMAEKQWGRIWPRVRVVDPATEGAGG
jgi:uncharacterized protein